ncbi:PREDICTED: putative F-box protein At3g49980 [Erythranthe guttata]|uniref:putative F-box protein At3g49980 n=1 Tax=Erythranthe guttata TaxID=4155 RepID=UPI00064DF0F4|nr:PREDICTED: putative F-box protein At3g49980 [Erythranthe guttata]XP_012856901.1 PREDICTED: putative F-box protein At3g49980 [Erythranthe guttata]XP_012856902.1 PREDICTED: putative F-box protein At3g49980 [Erythranthe guttata]|eukprot:XP_012856900.1 PREDICTED: putative F-box protein At3g49980 [Erythranthe guttata]
MSIEHHTSNLPNEIIEIILLHLPIKSLLRFKSVSKSWNSIISDPVFTHTHLQFSNSPHLFLIKNRSFQGAFSLLKLEAKKFHREAVLSGPYGWNTVLCHCNGVLLLTDSYFKPTCYALWNPSTRTETYFTFRYTFYEDMNYGICYDPAIHDFKVVFAAGKNYAVFCCKTDTWTRRVGFPFKGTHSGVFADGAYYWVWRDKEDVRHVVYFDSRIDKLKRLQKPKQLTDEDHVSVACLKDSLCLYCNALGDETKVRFWIKEKGSSFKNCWNEFSVIENVQTSIWSFRPLCFLEDKIVIRLESARFLIYSLCDNTFEEFVDDELCFVDLDPYKNSLFFTNLNAVSRRRRVIVID